MKFVCKKCKRPMIVVLTSGKTWEKLVITMHPCECTGKDDNRGSQKSK